ncbi:isopentenyl-diphosphate delta-isomerase [Longilinea arvoryzae]|uniref:Isopentenyl-diphosphate delta-isomerase n=1 Tax=Longilinea arvoryzae TaxID=360412 RepID=A0A0S7BME4_9CHLR|nr:type 2 isopentenyl-diphosphate Delta-isomerase [Longilinea arvoryzae]GAP14981.1 isopentenyl-diphosphate delta-isomerase [Longilinea arvoryzae]
MPDNPLLPNRKADQIRINREEDVQSGLTSGLEHFRFHHRALPELDLEEIDLSQSLLGKTVRTPILISSMTGGTAEAETINRVLAQAAQETGIAMGVGSQRTGIEHPELAYTFEIRKYAPDILLFANIGAVQLNYGYDIDQCKRAVDMIGADALILHLNALQEALQPEGDTRFSGLAQRIEQICRQLTLPVIAKEVGWGFSEQDIRLLQNAGVTAIDVAGAGGTSWSQVEMHRLTDPRKARVAAAFQDWGIPTAEAIRNVRRVAPDLLVIASGGLKNGIDIAKCIALGARLGGMAGPFLKAASQSVEVTLDLIHEIDDILRTVFFATGSRNIPALQDHKIFEEGGHGL